MKEIDINRMLNNKQILKIGELNTYIIKLLGIPEKPRNIKFAYDRLEHCNKHITDFKNINSYNKSIKLLPSIIQNPDYVGFNTKNNSIEYIKRIDEITLVAIRLKQKGDLFLRSIYPISEVKLHNGIKSGEIREVKRDTK